MDLTTLTYLLIVAIAYLGYDAVRHPPDAILEAEAIGSYEKTALSPGLVSDVLNEEVERISATPTIMTRPKIRIGRLSGLAVGLAESMKLQAVAYALQAQFGYRFDQIKLSLYGEGGTAKVLVAGMGRQRMSSFQEQLTLEQGETIVGLIQRATLIGMAHIDPYLTALSEVQRHAQDKDFKTAETISNDAMAALPPTPTSFERSLFENLNGLIALFRGDAKSAHEWFERAEASCPDNTAADAVTILNLAFADIQIDRDAEAVAHIQQLLRDKPPTDKVLLSTAYMTMAAGQLGSTHDLNEADITIAKAIEAYPEGSSAYDLWADIKREKGDVAAAERMHIKALETSPSFENYGEIATLYFRLAWRENQPVLRSPYTDPELGAVHPAKGG